MILGEKNDDDFGQQKQTTSLGKKIHAILEGKKMTNLMCVLEVGLSCEQKSEGTRLRERVTERGREGG